MIKPTNSVQQVKKTIEEYYMQEVNVTVNLGRNKKVNYKGVLTGIYPALFCVTPNDKGFLGKTSYSYAEVLCRGVSLKLAQKKA